MNYVINKGVHLIKSKLFKDTLAYSLINLLDKAIPFLIMPIISRALSKEDMGYYSLYQVTFQIFIPLLTLCIDYSISINYFKLDKIKFPIFFSTSIYLTAILWSFFVVLCSIFLPQLSRLLGLNEKWILVTFFVVLLNFLNQVRTSLYQQQRKPIVYGFFSVPLMLTKNLLALYFILVLNLGWEGVILGHLIGQFIFSIISVVSFVKSDFLVFIFDRSLLNHIFKVSIPIGIEKLSSWFGNSLNRIVINSLIGAAATGSYSIGATFGTIFSVFESAVNRAYAPYLFEQLANYSDEIRKKLSKLVLSYYFLYIFVGILVSLVGYYGVGLLFGEKYLDTQAFIIPVVISSVITGLCHVHINFIFFSEKTYIITANSFICAVLNVPTAYLFTKHLGLIGTAYSLIIVEFIKYLLTLFYADRLYKIF